MADIPDLKSVGLLRAGSSPASGTNHKMITIEIARKSKIGDVFHHTIIKGLTCKVIGDFAYNKTGNGNFTLKVKSKDREFAICDNNKRNWRL